MLKKLKNKEQKSQVLTQNLAFDFEFRSLTACIRQAYRGDDFEHALINIEQFLMLGFCEWGQGVALRIDRGNMA